MKISHAGGGEVFPGKIDSKMDNYFRVPGPRATGVGGRRFQALEMCSTDNWIKLFDYFRGKNLNFDDATFVKLSVVSIDPFGEF